MIIRFFKNLSGFSLLAGVLLALTTAFAAEEVSRKTEREIAKAVERSEGGDRAAALDVIDGRLDDRGLNDVDRAALYLARAMANAGEGGDLDAAAGDLQTALALEGVPAWQRDELVYALAEIYVAQSRETEALALLREHNSMYGASEQIMALMAELEVATGERVPTDLPDRAMRPVSTSAPRFPAGCSRNEPEYRVSVVFDVTPEGQPENIRVVDATDPCLAPAARTAVSGWRFDPAIQSGYLVITRDVPVTVTFSPS